MPLRFERKLIADERYESAGVFDVNNDGIPDIVSGAYWYEGPEFEKQYFVGEVIREGEELYGNAADVPRCRRGPRWKSPAST